MARSSARTSKASKAPVSPAVAAPSAPPPRSPDTRLIDMSLELSADAERDLEARAAAVGVSPQILAGTYVLFMLGYRPDGSKATLPGHSGLDLVDVAAARRAYPDIEPGKPLPPPR